MSFGDKLRKQAEEREAAESGQWVGTLAQRRAALEVQERQSTAHFLFARVKLDIEEAVESRRPFKGRRVPDELCRYKNGGYAIFEDCEGEVRKFADWCENNNLTYSIEYEHDGVGVSSWHSVHVKPI